jgi:hypothetical protein
MIFENLYFLDSLNFQPRSLESVPKSFDLTCKKVYYPHFYNTDNNLKYVGTSPEPKFQLTDYKSGDERAKFLEWYEEQNVKIFCNKQELFAYCMDDVNVLRLASWAFRKLFLKLVKMDLFWEAITLSSIYNKLFRIMFLKPDTVCIIPRAGYRIGSPFC